MTTRVVTEMIKSIFSESDKPTTIVSDNGPFCSSKHFAKEMAKWGINHINKLLHHHQSDRLAEVYVKISKAVLQKAKDTNEDPHLAMLEYMTTPISPTIPTPVELTHGCKPHATLEVNGIVVEAAKSLKNQQKSDENQLVKGQAVMYKTLPEKIWKKANVIKYVGNQSCLIHADDGVVYRHTRFHLSQHTPQQTQTPMLAAQDPQRKQYRQP